MPLPAIAAAVAVAARVAAAAAAKAAAKKVVKNAAKKVVKTTAKKAAPKVAKKLAEPKSAVKTILPRGSADRSLKNNIATRDARLAKDGTAAQFGASAARQEALRKQGAYKPAKVIKIKGK
jgi:hypothetical protein